MENHPDLRPFRRPEGFPPPMDPDKLPMSGPALKEVLARQGIDLIIMQNGGRETLSLPPYLLFFKLLPDQICDIIQCFGFCCFHWLKLYVQIFLEGHEKENHFCAVR